MRAGRFIGFAALLASFSSVAHSTALGDDEGISLHRLRGPIYLVEDNHYVTTNSLVYVGPSSVTVIGATWTPDTARILAEKIKHVTNRPIREVIDTSPEPEWSLNLDYTTIVAGHWSAIHGPELVDRYLGFLDTYQRGQQSQ